jgi:hypothetical protein
MNFRLRLAARLRFAIFIATALSPAFRANATVAPLNIYPVQSSIYPASTDYTMVANGQSIPVTHFRNYDIAQFAMGSGTTAITLTKINNTNIGSYSISPQKLGIHGTVSGSSVTFSVSSNQYLIVQLDGRPKLVIAIDPLESNIPPSNGTGIFNVTDSPYNAVSSTVTYSTTAFQNALNDAAAWGSAQGNGAQGTVYVPAGIWTVGNLFLRSNLAFYLAPGAVIRFTGDAAQYQANWYKTSQGRNITWFISTRYSSTNIKMFGRGTIDGDGKQSLTVSNLGMNFLVPIYTSNFTLDGISFRESSSWGIMVTRASNVSISNVKVFNAFDLGEDDGIDVQESSNVQVHNAIALGLDDNFSTKTWDNTTDIFKNVPGNPLPLNGVTFDTLVAFTYCYGLKVGQGVIQPQSGITFSNATVYDAAVGIGIDHRYGTATASNVTFNNIDIERIDFTNAGNRTWLALFVENTAGSDPIDGVTVENVNVRAIGNTPARLNGESGSPINNVTLENILMPGSSSYATTLVQMNITGDSYHGPVTIVP